MASWQRTHTCGELRETHLGQAVTLNGWVNTYRSYNDQIFLDLRDRYGLTQVVIEADHPELFKMAQDIRNEWVISVSGKVRERLPNKHNPKLATGDIEVLAQDVKILNRCPTPPFEVLSVPQEGKTFGEPELANEDLRLQYRYLDLRRPTLQRTLAMRHRLNKVIRDNLDSQGFLELETPLLGRSSPEGARDYLVPSRVNLGSWYALPQSPQLYKQILMVAGYDKYFQIARCLRDEDLRADRQPEFTQLDVEMSFVEMDDIFTVIENLTVDVFKRCLGVEIKLPLPRLKYDDVMLKYGSDKPDLRYGLEIVDVGDIAAQTEFQAFRSVLDAGGKVRALNASGAADKFSRKQIDELAEVVKRAGGKGCAWVKVEAEKFAGGIEKFLAPPVQQLLRAWTPRPAICCCSSPTRKTSSARGSAVCVNTWRACSISTTHSGWITRLPGCMTSLRLSGTTRKSAGPPTITRSPPRGTRTSTSSKATPAACGPRRMTSSSTATSAAAAAFVFTTPKCSRASSRCSACPWSKRNRASASCSTRSSSAPRRTAASPWASTASP